MSIRDDQSVLHLEALIMSRIVEYKKLPHVKFSTHLEVAYFSASIVWDLSTYHERVNVMLVLSEMLLNELNYGKIIFLWIFHKTFLSTRNVNQQ